MKHVVVVKASEVKIKPFTLDDFTQTQKSNPKSKKVTKKFLKQLADELGLDYNDKQIAFTKKIMTAYLKR